MSTPEFSTLIDALFKLQESLPDMRWHVGADEGPDLLVITIPVGEDNEKLLNDARALFAPADSTSYFKEALNATAAPSTILAPPDFGGIKVGDPVYGAPGIFYPNVAGVGTVLNFMGGGHVHVLLDDGDKAVVLLRDIEGMHS